MKGLLITFEGGEGSGKTTLIEGIYQVLKERGCPVLKTRAPGGTKAGAVIRSLLLETEDPLAPKTELLLFLADRAEHVEKVLLPALNEGKIVLCDRYNDSTIAYQGAARGFPQKTVEKLCLFATEGLVPDLTFYLDLDPQKGLLRRIEKSGKKDKIEREELAFHKKVHAAFLDIAKHYPDRIHLLDASESKEVVCEKALQQIYLLQDEMWI